MQDPAFLFYPSDFVMGCSDLTMEERGQYITLLCLQHQKGTLTKKSIGLNLGLSFDNLSEDLQSKFVVEDENNIYNVRLNKEIAKRRAFSEKQRENGKKGGRPRKDNTIQVIEKKLLKTSQKQPQIESEEIELKESLSPELFLQKLEAGEIKGKEVKTETQKKPNPKPKLNPKETLLENRNRVRDIDENKGKAENKKEPKSKSKISLNPELEMPEEFKPLWLDWLEYKIGKKSTFKYAGTKFEQMGVNKLIQYSGGDVEKAKQILEYTFFRNWEGFRTFEESQDKNFNSGRNFVNNSNNGGFETNR